MCINDHRPSIIYYCTKHLHEYNMSPSPSISTLITVAVIASCWATIIIVFSDGAKILENSTINNSASAPILLEQEAMALLQTGWWNTSTTTTRSSTSPRNWPGITCNQAGSIISISLLHDFQAAKDFRHFNFSSFPNLVLLDLAGARLQGTIPAEICTLSKLTHLDLSRNQLTGQLPASLGNLSKLVRLDVSQNQIMGYIPLELGKLRSLVVLNLSSNNFHGPVPPTLGLLRNLTHLYIYNNQISGELPLSLTKLTQLMDFQASQNQINGCIPLEIGELKNLLVLSMSTNNLSGQLPSTIGQLTKLNSLSLYVNQINGSIPREIWKLTSLTLLDLGSNKLTGKLPPALGQLTNLKELYLNSNQFSGFIPLEIGKLVKLGTLHLKLNMLSGSIPWTLGNLTKLTKLKLHSNKIKGSIPREIGNLKNLKSLKLRNNRLSGSIPIEICTISTLIELDLSHNLISGEIPSQLGNMTSLGNLNISYNNLTGHIPSSLASVPKIDLSYNSLSGPIHPRFGHYLASDHVALFEGNKDLCGAHNIKGFPPCFPVHSSQPSTGDVDPNDGFIDKDGNHSQKVRISTIIVLISVLVLTFPFIVLTTLFYTRRPRNDKNHQPGEITEHTDHHHEGGLIFSIWNYDGKIAYEDIIQATEDFDIKYCIGTGGYGSVYKARLPSGKVVAVKKLHSSEAEQLVSVRSLANEVETLSKIRHRNIVRLYGFCLHKRCTFLIYEYMERGSLFCFLNDDVEALELDWEKRVKVIKGVAQALCYMHHDCTPPIVHRDVSSNNILLNSEMEAVVCDFGTARLMDPDSSNQTVLAGTCGYIAPGEFNTDKNSSSYEVPSSYKLPFFNSCIGKLFVFI